MNIPPLCIIQARMNSTRLPGKMLLELGGETLIARAWRIACEAFGAENCVVAIPVEDGNMPLVEELGRIGATFTDWPVPVDDVLGRFYHCAHTYRWHPDSVIVRYTPDDPFKSVEYLQRVSGGERLTVELGGEAFTLAMLDAAEAATPRDEPMGRECSLERVAGRATGVCRCGREIVWRNDGFDQLGGHFNQNRQHITDALFPFRLPPMAGAGCTIDTPADYEAAKARIENGCWTIHDIAPVGIDNWLEAKA